MARQIARQGTAKQAIDARNANATTAPATTATTVNPMAETAMPATPTVTPVVTPSTPVTAPPRVEGQWNYGSADAPVYAKPATASSTPATPAPAPATTPTQPLTTEIGREQALGQLAKQPEAQTRQAEIKSVRENLKDDSGKQLWSNMEGISNTNANLLNNRRDFDEAFGYKAKDAGEKAMVDSFWRAKNKMDSKSLYNALETGETIPKESIKTPQFEDAVIRKQSVNKFENLTPFQLSKQLNTSLIPGTQAYNDLMAKNPKLVSDANKLSSINMSVTARQPAKTDYMEMLSNFFTQSQTMQQPATVAKIMNSDPSIGAKTTEVQALDGELNEAKMRLKNLQADVTERYKGTGASKSTIRAKALAESQDLIDEIAMIEANRSSASSALSTLIQNAKDEYAMARQDRQDAIESQQKQVANLMAFAKMGIEQDNEEYKRAFDQYKYDTDYLRSEASKDSDFAREMEKLDIQNQYLAERDDIGYQRDVQLAKMGYGQQERMANMGYQNQRDMANIGFEQDIQKMMAQYDLNDEKDNKAFKQELIKTGKTPAEADALSRNASGNWNGANGKSLLYAEDGTFIKSTLSQTTNPYGGIECAEYVSRMLGTRVGSTFAEKKKLNNEKEGTIGSIAVWQPAKSGPLATYGHAGVIVGDDGQGNWLIKSANYKLDGRISTDKIPKSSIDGYRTTDIGKEMDSNQYIGQQSGTTGFSQQSIPQFQNYLTAGKIGTSAEEVKAINAEFGSVAEFKRQAELYNNSENGPRQKELEKLNKLKTQLEGLIGPDKQGAINNSIGAWQWTANAKIPTSTRNEKEAYLSDVQNFLEGKTLQTLIDAKAEGATFGALSNEELKMLQNSASQVNQLAIRGDKEDKNRITGFRGSKEAYEKAINSMIKTYNDLIVKKQGQINNTNQPAKGGTTQAPSTAGGSTAPSNIPASVIQDAINRRRATQ